MRFSRPVSWKAAAFIVPIVIVASFQQAVMAQRPFFANDPLYRDETARRTYHNGYAISGELSYRSLDPSSAGVISSLGVLFRADYQLGQQFDVSAIFDAYGGHASQNLRLSWLAVRHHWHSDGADMAVRLAFEPRPPIGGGFGFRQTDLGFFHSRVLSPTVETEIALGVRHVRTGFPTLDELRVTSELSETHGWEGHVVMTYNMVFDPARSHVSLAFGYEAGRYDVTQAAPPPLLDDTPSSSEEFAGHVLWIQTGLHWHRPSYQIVPFVSIPLVSGKRGDGFVRGKGPRFVNVGVRVTLR